MYTSTLYYLCISYGNHNNKYYMTSGMETNKHEIKIFTLYLIETQFE